MDGNTLNRIKQMQLELRALRAECVNLQRGNQELVNALQEMGQQKAGMELRNALFIRHFAPDTLRVEIPKTESEQLLEDVKQFPGVYNVTAGDDAEHGVLWFQIVTQPSAKPGDEAAAESAAPEPAKKPDLVLVGADAMDHLPPPPRAG